MPYVATLALCHVLRGSMRMVHVAVGQSNVVVHSSCHWKAWRATTLWLSLWLRCAGVLLTCWVSLGEETTRVALG